MRLSASSVLSVVAISASANSCIVNAAPVLVESREARGGSNTARLDSATGFLGSLGGFVDNARYAWDAVTAPSMNVYKARDIVVDKESLAKTLASRDVDDDFTAPLESREARGGSNTARLDSAAGFLGSLGGFVDNARYAWDAVTAPSMNAYKARDILDNDEVVDSLVSARGVSE